MSPLSLRVWRPPRVVHYTPVPGPMLPSNAAGSISVEDDVLAGSGFVQEPRSCWELNQDDDCATSVERFVFTLSGNSLGPLLAARVFIYYLFINHKSRKDLRKLIIKDTNTVKLLKQNTTLEPSEKEGAHQARAEPPMVGRGWLCGRHRGMQVLPWEVASTIGPYRDQSSEDRKRVSSRGGDLLESA